jgi:hypothetical protein
MSSFASRSKRHRNRCDHKPSEESCHSRCTCVKNGFGANPRARDNFAAKGERENHAKATLDFRALDHCHILCSLRSVLGSEQPNLAGRNNDERK